MPLVLRELVALAASEILLPYSDPQHNTLPGRENAPWIEPTKKCLVKPVEPGVCENGLFSGNLGTYKPISCC